MAPLFEEIGHSEHNIEQQFYNNNPSNLKASQHTQAQWKANADDEDSMSTSQEKRLTSEAPLIEV